MAAPAGLAEWLQRACAERGWGPARLGREAKLSTSYASQLMSGERKARDHDTQVALAQAFGLSWEGFMEAVKAGVPPPKERYSGVATERAILEDPNLTSAQREALIVHYRSYRRR